MFGILTLDNLVALLALISLEVVLGIDNVVILTIIVGKLEVRLRNSARRLGMGLAMFGRIALLLAIGWVMHLVEPLFSVFGHAFSGRDVIMLLGGLFLIAKATREIHERLELANSSETKPRAVSGFAAAILQIILFDLVFSLDSVITAVGMVEELWLMITAVVISVCIMMAFAKKIGEFIDEHPTFKMLALSFLLMVGFLLLTEGFGKRIDKGYIYFAMGFSLLVEFLNIRAHPRHRVPV